MYNRKLASAEKKDGEASKRSHECEESDEGVVVDRSKANGFSSFPRHLQELILWKTSTDSRLKLFQVNQQLREWMFNEGLFPRDVEGIMVTLFRPRHEK